MKRKLLMVIALLSAVPMFAQPAITSFAPISGPIGTEVTISGANFNSVPTNNFVYFGAVKAAVTSATTTTLKVKVPKGATYEPMTVTTGGLTAYSALPFLITFNGGEQPFTQKSFAAKGDFPTGIQPCDDYLCDVDGDGKPDILTVDYNTPVMQVFRNKSTEGNISFAAKKTFSTNGLPYSISIGDIDGDGRPDVITHNRGSSTVSIFRNISTVNNISFTSKIDYATGSFPLIGAIADIDGDGKPDIITANNSANSFSVLRNTSSAGNVSFETKRDFATGAAGGNPFTCAARDLDGDGKPDVVIAYRGIPKYVSVFRNTSSGGTISFASKVDCITDAQQPNGVSIGDLDNDGKPDVIVANFGDNFSPSYISFFRNKSTSGTLSFDNKVNYPTGGAGSDKISINDLNGDGKPDVTVNNYWSNVISVFRNLSTSGNIVFDQSVLYATNSGPTRPVIGDLDGDGKPDIAIANIFSGQVSVLRNLIGESVCNPPSNLRVTNITDTSARLHWTLPDTSVCALQIRYRPVGSSEWMKRLEKPAKDHIVLRSLVPNTTYEWKIRSVCGPDTTKSAWVKGPDFSTTITFASTTESSDALIAGKFGVYVSPNPVTNNLLNLRITNASATSITVSIIDMQGKTFINQNLLLNGSSNKTIDVSALPKGVYILKVINNKNEQQQIKFVKAN